MKRILFGIMILLMFVMVGAVFAEEAAKSAAKEASENGITIARMEIAGGIQKRNLHKMYYCYSLPFLT